MRVKRECGSLGKPLYWLGATPFKCLFRSILRKTGITDKDAPIFHFYLNKHIQLDEDFHAPLSLKLLNSLGDGDGRKIQEAIDAANEAIMARIEFWDGVLAAINQKTG